jgi:protein-tyrosine phosphatase
MPKPWITDWLKEQERWLEEQRLKEEHTSKKVQYLPMREDPPMRRFPTNSGELYYGRAPDYKTLAKLRDMGVDLIWNLAQELDIFVVHEKSYVPHVLHGNISDYDVPSNGSQFLKQVNQVAAMLRGGKKVFIHCMAGHGRTGLALAALGVVLNGKTAKTALIASRAASGGPETPDQVHFVKQLAHYLKTGKQLPEPKPEDKEDPLMQKKRMSLEPAPKPKEPSAIDKIISRYEQPKKQTDKH